MAQTVNQLTAAKAQKLKALGMYPDGAGLYLQVTGANAKSWVLRYSLRGKAREMGLGSLRKVTLADARRKVAECHKLLDGQVDPIEHRAQARGAAALANATSITFKEAAARYIAMRSKGLRNAKHAAQWGTTVATYAEPILATLLVRDIDVGHVHRVLEPIWSTKPETAGRVRGRIEKILGWAKVNNYRDGENPARWRDNLDQLLPKLSEVRKVKHHPSTALCRIAGVYGKATTGRWYRRPRSRIYDLDGRAHPGGDPGRAKRNQQAREALDRSGGAHEAQEGTPGPAL